MVWQCNVRDLSFHQPHMEGLDLFVPCTQKENTTSCQQCLRKKQALEEQLFKIQHQFHQHVTDYHYAMEQWHQDILYYLYHHHE